MEAKKCYCNSMSNILRTVSIWDPWPPKVSLIAVLSRMYVLNRSFHCIGYYGALMWAGVSRLPVILFFIDFAGIL